MSDEELERRAQEMAEKSLANLPQKVRETKLAAVKAGILKRLRSQPQAASASAPPPAAPSPPSAPASAPAPAPPSAAAHTPAAAAFPAAFAELYDPFAPAQVFAPAAQRRAAELFNPFARAAPASTPPPVAEAAAATRGTAPGAAAEQEQDLELERVVGLRRPPTELPPPQDGVEACGDDPWFADPQVRLALRDAVELAHAEFKILVGDPAEEIVRILPKDGRQVGAGAVLRLGGYHLGGFGEVDVAYAYRQLSRALHPDKNRDNPDAGTAFNRLHDAQGELKKGLEATRRVVKRLSAPFLEGDVSQEELKRPQEALFAAAARTLSAVLSLSGEGEAPAAARVRAAACLQVTAARGGGRWAAPIDGRPETLLGFWLQDPDILQEFGSMALRGAYDCAPKRYRAHFLSLLARVAQFEGVRSGGCVRQQWAAVWETFPELQLWQELLSLLRKKSLVHGRAPQRKKQQEQEEELRQWLQAEEGGSSLPKQQKDKKRKRGTTAEEEEVWSQWGRRWRRMIRAVLPSGAAAAAPWSDPEVRKLCAALWRDFADPLSSGDGGTDADGARRCLGLFRTGSRGAADVAAQRGAAPAEWAFVPATDLLLIVGEGIVGTTVEGVFADGPASRQRLAYASAVFQTMMS